MYKISINDHLFCLLKSEELDDFVAGGYEVVQYTGDKEILSAAIDRLEKTDDEILKIAFYANDYHRMKSDFKSLFRVIKAMGGIVVRSSGAILLIYRRGKWDLPKGKKEKYESKRECALREVEEETGLQQLELKSRVGKTRHIYRHLRTGERIIKITYWYKMVTTAPDDLALQSEEDITDAKWMTIADFLDGNYATFANIKDILQKYRRKAGEVFR